MDKLFYPFAVFYSTLNVPSSLLSETSTTQSVHTSSDKNNLIPNTKSQSDTINHYNNNNNNNMVEKEQEISNEDSNKDAIKKIQYYTDIMLRSFPSPIGYDLPLNVQLITLERWNHNKILLRLGHAMAIDDLPSSTSSSSSSSSSYPLSYTDSLIQPVTVDIQKLIYPIINHAQKGGHHSNTNTNINTAGNSKKFRSNQNHQQQQQHGSTSTTSRSSSKSQRVKIFEMNLTANQLKSDMLKNKLKWRRHNKNNKESDGNRDIIDDVEDSHNNNELIEIFSKNVDEWTITLKPMQIRTFLIELS